LVNRCLADLAVLRMNVRLSKPIGDAEHAQQEDDDRQEEDDGKGQDSDLDYAEIVDGKYRK